MRSALLAAVLVLVSLTVVGDARSTVIIGPFSDFSSLTFSPTTSGDITLSGFTVTFTGDSGSFFSDPDNGSSNAILLGDNVSDTRVNILTLAFSTPIVELQMELDGMHLIQSDSITTSAGTWMSFPSTLSLSGSTLSSTEPIINRGGSGIDDDLDVVLVFNTPVSSVSFTNTGAFGLDSFEVLAIPEPSTALLLASGLAVLALRRRRKALARQPGSPRS